MIAPVPPATQAQIVSVSTNLEETVRQAGTHLRNLETDLQKLGPAYSGDPEAVDHIDKLRNNLSPVSMEAQLLKMAAEGLTRDNSGSMLQLAAEQLEAVRTWRVHATHAPTTDGRPHVPVPPGQTCADATRAMTQYLATLIETHKDKLGPEDRAALERDFAAVTTDLGALYRHMDQASRIASVISTEGNALGQTGS